MKLFEAKKTFWRYRHGQHCFDHVAQIAAILLEDKWVPGHALYYPLCVSMVVLYARPFGRCDGIGKLDKSIVPQAWATKHKRILDMRNKSFAHYDTQGFDKSIEDVRPGLRIAVEPKETVVELKESFLSPIAVKQIGELADILRQKCGMRVDAILAEFGDYLPKESGIYELDFDESSTSFFSKNE